MEKKYVDDVRRTTKVCTTVPRNSMTLAAFCLDNFHSVLARNRIKSRKYSWYESVFLQLSSGRHATLTLSHGKTFEIGLQPINGSHSHPLKVCEADVVELSDALGIDRDCIQPWRCGDLLKWLPRGTEPKSRPHAPTGASRRRLRKKQLSLQVDELLEFASGSKPRFVEQGPGANVVPLKHKLGRPASRKDLDWLRNKLRSNAPELLEFYTRANGAQLFVDAHNKNTHFALVAIGDMESEFRELDESLRMTVINTMHDASGAIDDDGRLRIDGVPKWWPSSIVFGVFGGAAERLYLATEGRHAGHVFAYEHDDSTSVRIAFSVNELFHAIHTNPVGFVRANFGGAYFAIEKYEDSSRSLAG